MITSKAEQILGDTYPSLNDLNNTLDEYTHTICDLDPRRLGYTFTDGSKLVVILEEWN